MEETIKMTPILRDDGYYVGTTLNNWLKDSGSSELIALYYYTANNRIERTLTEFAARLCYNSTSRLGTSPRFVEKVLEDGHLSVAEHVSFFFKMPYMESAQGYRKPFIEKRDILSMFDKNRYIEVTEKAIFSNLRALQETLVGMNNNFSMCINTTLEPIFPDFFKKTSWQLLHDETPKNLYVPGEENVCLLAFNFGSTYKSKIAPGLKLNKFNVYRNWTRYTFLIECSRNCANQLVRHRGASISQESQRYVDAKNNRGFVFPPDATQEQVDSMALYFQESLKAYERLRDTGMKKEDARMLLPGGIKTRMVVSFNYYELLHFLKLRTDKHAQWEIRDIAFKMLKQAALVTDKEKGGGLHELSNSVFAGGSGI